MENIGLLLGDRTAPARAAATVAILFGLAAMTGWFLGIQALTSVIPGSAEMKINTAVAMALSGGSLLMLASRSTLRQRFMAQASSIAVLALGLATLAEYILGRSFGIDELLVKDTVGAFNAFHGRMSPVTATAFVAVSAALLALPHRQLRVIASVGAGGALMLAGLSLLGYLWGASELITDRWVPPVALNTAGCLALLGGGILLMPRSDATGPDRHACPPLAAVEIKILAGFILALALLLIGGSYTYRASVQFENSVAWVAHTQEVRGALQAVHGAVAGAEVALRDYLLTHDESTLKDYTTLRSEALRHLADVRSLTVDNPGQRANMLALQPIVEGRLAAMASALTAFQDFGLAAARAVIGVTRNRHATQAVRAQIAVMDAEEVRLLNQRDSQIAGVRATTLVSLLATLTVASGLFFALFRGIHREMLARRDAENLLRASDRYNRSILDSSPDCLGVLSLDGRLMQMTPHGLRLLEIDDFAAVANMEWVKVWKGADRVAAKAALDCASVGVDGRFQGMCPTLKGTEKWWDVIVKPIAGPDGRPDRLLTVSRDITEVKLRENSLNETNRFLDSLFEALPLMVYVKDARSLRYVRMNREGERITGFKREEMIGRTARDILPLAEAEVVEAQDFQVLTTGQLMEIEDDVTTTPSGRRTRHSQKLPIFDAAGNALYLLGISEDVTEQRLAEHAIRELNIALGAKADQLQTSNKELESFSYSVSHDLRAPLRAIDGFALMIEEDYGEQLDAEGRRYLAVIRENSKRMGALIDDLLEFSRLGRLPVVSHDINVGLLVQEVVDELLNSHPEAATRIEIGALPPARGDRGLLRQVWTNLIANAIKYSSKSPDPAVWIAGEQTAEENRYSIRDNGVGFNMAYVEKLFGVFQRLHRADEFSGTGVGLAIVHRVVTRHGGRVWAEGRLNGGAVFSFALPRETIDG
jgi:PAS domain S-box-containing protein